jgi:hypothetical protein
MPTNTSREPGPSGSEGDPDAAASLIAEVERIATDAEDREEMRLVRQQLSELATCALACGLR